jgi:glutamate-ammonia-ligase adenylyltransferase
MTRPDAVLDAPGVAGALEHSADPHGARTVLARILEEQPELATDLRDDRTVRDALIAVAGASRSLSTALAHDPGMVEPLRDGTGLATERTVDGYRASVDAASVVSADDLRVWKRRELLRIAARDLLRLAGLPVVGRELAALAEVCLQEALRLVDAEGELAVVAMGNIGGGEVN